MFELQEQDEGGDFKNMYIDYMQSNTSYDDSFLPKKKESKKKNAKPSLNEFIEIPNNEPIDKTDD